MKFTLACLFLHLATAAGENRRRLAAVPWSDLEAQLSSDTVLSDASAEAYVKECYPFFRDARRDERTNHDLIAAPSGLCMDALFCAHERCNPQPEFHDSTVNATENAFWLYPYSMDPPFSAGDDAVLQGWLASSNTAYNLPHKVLFPRTAEDVVAAVKFAKEHGVKVSVKNSGHSYAGSSTMKDSLLINMMQYARYALPAEGEPDATNVGVEECADQDGDEITLENQACMLARARGKPAVLRVGGGENFDKSYRAVKAFNEKNGEGYKYHMIGGAAGTVSPMGWTWMGGLAATTGGRMLGFGVDQVLQIEAVLPAGYHVRFGPTEWEDAEGFLVPKTTNVTGECHIDGKWGECPEDIDFDDLWYAMRGGGGGAWGVVLSTYLQLHGYLPFEQVTRSENCDALIDDDSGKTSLGLIAEFALNFFLDPAALGVASGDSNACGLAGGEPIGRFDCFGDGAGGKVVEQWKSFVGGNAGLEEAGFTADDIATITNCLEVSKYKDYGETGMFTEGPYAGKIQDTLKPGYISDLQGTLNQLVPQKWILENKPTMIEFLTNKPGGGYFAFGGDTDRIHDQTASFSRGHRDAGFLIFYSFPPLGGNNTQLLEQYDFAGDAVPPYVGANHVGPNSYGPLKSDHSQPCPVWDLTNTEADEMCVPILEAVYGTEGLGRLEAIKRAIDPDTLFDCYRCVGNKAMSDETGGVTTTAVMPDETEGVATTATTAAPPTDPSTGGNGTSGDADSSSGMRVATALSKAALAGLVLLPMFLHI